MDLAQLKDSEFKHLIKSDKKIYGSDAEWDFQSVRLIIEYENSSRGMVANFLRILRRKENRPDESIFVIFIRTRKHELLHNNDYQNFNFIKKIYKNKKVRTFVLNGSDLNILNKDFLEQIFIKEAL